MNVFLRCSGYNDGSFNVVDSEKFEEVASFHHRKDEVADIKFSPGSFFFNCILVSLRYLCISLVY